MAKHQQSFSIKAWSESDRPREKLRDKGRSILSDAELLAIILGSGNRDESAVTLSQRILKDFNNNLNALGKASLQELMHYKGIGEAKAISVAAAMELGRRRREVSVMQPNKINSSTSVYDLMQPIIGELPHEEFWILYLNNSNKVLHKAQLSKGGITGTLVDVRLVLKTAISNGAVSIILAHNHPSGTLKPSNADISITQKLKNAAQSLDIKVLDHLIITESSYFSFADEGLL